MTWSTVTTDDGVALAVSTHPGARRGVVAVHGLSASSANWLGTVQALRGAWEVVAPDLRGRGDSGKPADAAAYGMRLHGDDIATVIRAAGLTRALLVGHSMGAYIVEQVAARHPELVAGVLLVDGGASSDLPSGVDPDALFEGLFSSSVRRMRTTFPDRAAYYDFWRTDDAFAGEWNPLVEAYLDHDLGGTEPELRAKPYEEGVRADYRSLWDRTLPADNARIACPVHLMRAAYWLRTDQPPLLSDDLVATLRKQIPQLTDEVLPGLNHYGMTLTERGSSQVAARIASMAEELL
jgi:pimeloyl-ACP methyl ester carboxylesterase